MRVLQPWGGHDALGHQMHRVELDDGTVVRACPICIGATAEAEAATAAEAEAAHQADLARRRVLYAERRKRAAAAAGK